MSLYRDLALEQKYQNHTTSARDVSCAWRCSVVNGADCFPPVYQSPFMDQWGGYEPVSHLFSFQSPIPYIAIYITCSSSSRQEQHAAALADRNNKAIDNISSDTQMTIWAQGVCEWQCMSLEIITYCITGDINQKFSGRNDHPDCM